MTDTPDPVPRTLPTLEERRQAVEEGRLALDSSPAKLWLPIIVPALMALASVAVTTIISGAQTQRASYAQTQESERQRAALAQQRELENGRIAATMYFDKLADLRSKDTLSPSEQKRFVSDMQLIEALSGSDAINALLRRRWTEVNATAATRDAGSDKPAVFAGAPDLISRPLDNRYEAGQFIAFPQVPAGRVQADADRLSATLVALGFDVQATQTMAPDRVPRKNQVRYYRADHMPLATAAAAALEKRLCADVEAVWMGGGRLPNGVMEFWLGSGPEAQSRSPCE